ncbi:MAG: class I SAM-dependent methyltransferase [Cellvibrio sp.]|uniref:class I SAM-dependent methyltransferase n=1 Tax=Cellvibrio sp. TaxID=1965322 RepID=UPI0031ABEEAF
MNTDLSSQVLGASDFDAIKKKQQAMWASGNYGKVGSALQITGESLCEAMDLSSGESVLDVAAGNGNVTLAAARRYCRVTSTDYVQELLDQGRARAEADGLLVDYQQADAEKLPFANTYFDNVVSTFGVMFAPNQAQAAVEMLRVCRPGGKIGLANWTPDGFIGRLFKIVGRYVAPPAGVQSPAAWGTQDFLQKHFGHSADDIAVTTKSFVFRYLSSEHWLDIFRNYYGPVHKAFNALSTEQQHALAQDITQLISEFNLAKDGSVKVPSTYLEVVIAKKRS